MSAWRFALRCSEIGASIALGAVLTVLWVAWDQTRTKYPAAR